MTYENYRKELLKQAEALNAFLDTVTDAIQAAKIESEIRRLLSDAARIKEMHTLEARKQRQTLTIIVESRMKYPLIITQ